MATEYENNTVRSSKSGEEESIEESQPSRVDEVEERSTLSKIDWFFDGLLSRLTGTAEKTAAISKKKLLEHAPRVKQKAVEVVGVTRKTFIELDKRGDIYAKKLKARVSGLRSERIANWMYRNPTKTIMLAIIISLIIGLQAIKLIDIHIHYGPIHIDSKGALRSDYEAYLPAGHPATITLEEIREDWSTDIVVLYVEVKSGYNITDKIVLEELSAIEGDEFTPGLNYNRTDMGAEDKITYILSISTIVKEANSSAPRFFHAFEAEFERVTYPEEFEPEGNYTIPDQPRINAIVEQIPEELRRYVLADANGDRIYDRAAIIIGLSRDANWASMLRKIESACEHTKYCKITSTGPIPVTQAIQDRTVFEFAKTLPFIILFGSIVMILFHWNPKLLICAILPTACAIMVTFGILGMAHQFFIITPQIALVATLLLALGMAYALYITNRYAEGTETDVISRMHTTVRAIHTAILLSAVTTGIGFGALMIGSLPPMVTMGFALFIGIILCYVFTMILVPTLILALRYKKHFRMKRWRKIARIPLENRKKIMLMAAVILIISMVTLPVVASDPDYMGMAPADEPSVRAMDDYSKSFGAGQLSLILVRGVPYDPAKPTYFKDTMLDVDVLDDIDVLELQINDLEKVIAFSIIDAMKMIKIPENLSAYYVGEEGQLLSLLEGRSFWDAIHNPLLRFSPDVQKSLISVFYNTLTPEMRSTMINEDYSKALVYVDMPVMSVEATRTTVNSVDKVVDEYSAGKSTSHLTGMSSLLLAINDLIITSQLITLAISIALCWLVLLIIWRSIKFATITIIPVCLVVSWEPLTLNILNIPLSLFTVMIGSIMIGLGIDYSIQISQRVRLGGGTIDAVGSSVESVGISFVEATVTMLAGLTAVLFVPIPSVQEFILMIMLLLIFSAIAAMFILPALYVILIREGVSFKPRVRARARVPAVAVDIPGVEVYPLPEDAKSSDTVTTSDSMKSIIDDS